MAFDVVLRMARNTRRTRSFDGSSIVSNAGMNSLVWAGATVSEAALERCAGSHVVPAVSHCPQHSTCDSRTGNYFQPSLTIVSRLYWLYLKLCVDSSRHKVIMLTLLRRSFMIGGGGVENGGLPRAAYTIWLIGGSDVECNHSRRNNGMVSSCCGRANGLWD